MDLALNNLQRLICHKTQASKQPTEGLQPDYIVGKAIFLPVLVLRGKELLHWIFYLLLVVEASQSREMSHGSQQIRSQVQTLCWANTSFFQFFDTRSCPLRRRTPSLKLLNLGAVEDSQTQRGII